MMRTWRLMLDGAARGTWNMAVDLAILDSYRRGEVLPTLRLYDWSAPTLSLGYAQKVAEVNEDACVNAGIALVRRPTGGRAVLHGAGDLTYAVIASEREGFPGNVSGSYCLIAKAIVRSFEKLQLAVKLAPGTRPQGTSSACFSTATPADLVANGRKLVGSAQVRREGGFLQHGAVMLTQEASASEPLLNESSPSGMTNLRALLGHEPDLQLVRRAFCEGFQEAFDLQWQEVGLSPAEQRHASEIAPSFELS